MTPQEIYKNFLLKVNKNDTNTNIKVPKSQFVLLFNEQKDQFLDDVIKNKEAFDYIDDISELLELDYLINVVKRSDIKDDFKLPNDFFRRATAYSLTSKGECKNSIMVIWIIKPKNRDVYLQNSNLNPSFEYQETFGILNNKNLSVFKKDFKIEKTYLSYYRRAKDIDIEGYIHIDGTPSTNQETDLNEENIKLVINRTALEAARNYESMEQAKMASERQL